MGQGDFARELIRLVADQGGDPPRRWPLGGGRGQSSEDDADGQRSLVGTQVVRRQTPGQEDGYRQAEHHAHCSYGDAVGGGSGEGSRDADLTHDWPAPLRVCDLGAEVLNRESGAAGNHRRRGG